MKKDQKMYQKIEGHGKNLIVLMGGDTRLDPIKLCKSLFRLENKASKFTLQLCNGDIDQDTCDRELLHIKAKVQAIIGTDLPLFINYDPRGYALKLDDDFCRDKEIHRDLGGYGILAPNFNEVQS